MYGYLQLNGASLCDIPESVSDSFLPYVRLWYSRGRVLPVWKHDGRSIIAKSPG